MRKFGFLFVLILSCVSVMDAQVVKKIKYKRGIKAAEKRAIEHRNGGADFWIDPIEAVPVDVRDFRNLTAPTNWGKDLLLTDALRQRLVQECTYKVHVKVADTGEPDHVSLKQGQTPGSNYTTDASVADKNGHSTHVLGIIASELGLCDALVDKGLFTHEAVKLLADNGSGSFTWVATGVASERSDDVARIAKNEFVVWNGSFGGGTNIVDAVEAELKKSTDAGVIFCFASGNTGTAGVNYPACGKYSIGCGSLDMNLQKSSYSTTGQEVWAAMPGRNINSTYKNNTFASLSGTSMATPFLTAAVCIAYSKWGPKLKGLDLCKKYIAWCAKDLGAIGKDNEYGWGLALVENVLNRDPKDTPNIPVNPPPPPPPPSNQYQVDKLSCDLKKSYVVLWDNLAQSSEKDGVMAANTYKTAGKGSRKANKAFANKSTAVTFEIRNMGASTGSAADQFTKIEAAVSGYFTNRGFMLPKGQDESWAAYWAAYFLEMGLSQIYKIEIDVVAVRFGTVAGSVVLREKDLRHWPQ